MKISLDKSVFENLHPKFTILFLQIKDIDNKSKLKESKHLLKEVKELTKLTFNKDTVKNHHLISPWEVAREEFGKKAKHYHTSVEKLLKKTLSNKSVTGNNVITNLINYLQLRYIMPISADDYYKIDSKLEFKTSTGREKRGMLKRLHKNDLYYRDNSEILATNLDYWHSQRTSLSTFSNSALIHFLILPPLTKSKVKDIAKEAEKLIKAFCGGKTKSLLLDRRKSTGTI
tara:strand:+ start:4837 stop:5526 length:690 start_codon:yes stop_codon:yes gene_type:complete